MPVMFCCRCSYPLCGLTQNRCPECGAPFDPRRPDSYRGRPRTHWRRWVTIGLAGLVFAGFFLLGFVASQYCKLRTTEVCRLCGAQGEKREYRVRTIKLFSKRTGHAHTGLSRYLASQVGPHEHSWVGFETVGRDWRGRKTSCRLGTQNLALVYVLADAYPMSSLTELAHFVPDLGQIIGRDILQATSGASSLRCAVYLKAMCEDRSEENIRRMMERWNRSGQESAE